MARSLQGVAFPSVDHLYGIASVVGLATALLELFRRGRLLEQVRDTVKTLREASARASILVLIERLARLHESALHARAAGDHEGLARTLRQWNEDGPRVIGKANALPDSTERAPFIAAFRTTFPLVVEAIDVTAVTASTQGATMALQAIGTAVHAAGEYGAAVEIEVLQS